MPRTKEQKAISDRTYYFKNRDKRLSDMKKYRENNKKKINITNKKYRETHIEEIILGRKKYRQNHKDIIRERDRKYNQKNKEKIKIVHQKYYQKNRDRLYAKNREWNSAHEEEMKLHLRKRYKTDIQYKLSVNLRSRLNQAIKIDSKAGSAVKDLGCTIPELKIYIENHFLPGMTWGNWTKKGWHIDHIIPISLFDLTDKKQFLVAVHYSNLQPMWWKENLKKSNKIILAI